MTEEPTVVAVIDDDQSIRDALGRLFETVALKAELFGSVDEYLRASKSRPANCIVLDVRLPGPSGLDFQTQLARANNRTPIVFITAHADIPMSVRAMKAGAIEFLTKPFRHQELLDAVRNGIERDRSRRAEVQALADLQSRLASLTPRERQIMTFLAEGRITKQIAGEIGISAMTVRIHRNQVISKMGARSTADLVRMADKLGLPSSKGRAD
ncbi:response regulator transcription factor [Bradyrhizobium sp. AZCC 2289]|uniref:response regulator transcription factor n=1 Tax=Bradyrhizobium sp. AZCC 2289 TaxID=3117026 RepID=UPI002FF1385D